MGTRYVRRLLIETLEPRDLFYQAHGLNFGPYTAVGENPNFGPGQITEAELRQRATAIAPLTTAIRTFGTTGDLAPAARIIHDELDRFAAIGAWIGRDLAANQREIDALVAEAIAGRVDLAIVGSESLLRNDVTPDALVAYIQDVRAQLDAANISIPITTADVYTSLLNNPQVIAAVDVVFVNIYPFFEHIAVDQAVAAVHGVFQNVAAASGGKEVIISETGWPSSGSPLGNAVPSPENAADYFLNFVSWARAENVKYFYFEAYNEPWKTGEPSGVGPHWGIFDAQQQLKPGMQRVFDGETVPNNWSGLDFFDLPPMLTTNLPSFVISGRATYPDHVVKLNGDVIPESATGTQNQFAVAQQLSSGENIFTLTIEDPSGNVVKSATKRIVLNSSLSTRLKELVYVDVVPASGDVPALDGTIVLNATDKVPLGFLPGKHVRGISSFGDELYMHDRTVLSTATHTILRTLPFTQDIPSNGFLATQQGDRLYSRNEIVNLATNALVPGGLPADITTGNAFGSASVPGGPAISTDGGIIYGGRPLMRIDTVNGVATAAGVSSSAFVSDVALSPDGRYLLISSYGGAAGRLDIYDANSLQFLRTFGLSDFSGEIVFVDGGRLAAVGGAGNPALRGGRIILVDLDTLSLVATESPIQLADNLASDHDDHLYVSSDRLGVDVVTVGPSGTLARTESFFLGINQFPGNDQIRRLVYKPEVLNPWHNSLKPLDVNGDTFIAPLDALLVIIYLNATGGGRLPLPPVPGEEPPPYLDTSDDFAVGPLDALLIINYLNTGVASEEDWMAPEAPRNEDDMANALAAYFAWFEDEEEDVGEAGSLAEASR